MVLCIVICLRAKKPSKEPSASEKTVPLQLQYNTAYKNTVPLQLQYNTAYYAALAGGGNTPNHQLQDTNEYDIDYIVP